ncbi:MAG: hypothetical protein ABI185_02190 [Ginsengibacter sp.]
MKKIILFSIVITIFSFIPLLANAQLQKGNIMIGRDLASLNFIVGVGGY